MKAFNLDEYLSNGVENIVSGIIKASLKNPKESMFLFQYAKESKKAKQLRKSSEEKGEHIPPFLIGSITNQCNLHCKGCYARANQNCHTQGVCDSGILNVKEWEGIFNQAADLGISFILLAGGEPFLRQDVLISAAKQKRILFPIFTNGTRMDDSVLQLLNQNRNLIPVLSIEGNEGTTDARRGLGTYGKLVKTMKELEKKKILFAASVTVNKENIHEVFSDSFINVLYDKGCKGIIYVEYVPVDITTKEIALDDMSREKMMNRLNNLRREKEDMVFIAFPGDEKSSGGCLAAGRGFFHINAFGGAEPCPFSPYSDTNLKNTSLKEALNSPLFLKLKENGNLEQEHIGGCVLFEQEGVVRKLLGGTDEYER